MRLILVGPPGSGKGTQAKMLSQRLNLCHIGTGDLLRQMVQLGTPSGLRAKPFVEAGQLVPDDLVNDLIHERFNTEPRPECFVMDGYPRTVPQAHAFDQVLRQQFLKLDAVLHMIVPDEELVRRLSGFGPVQNPIARPVTTWCTNRRANQGCAMCVGAC